MNLSLKELMYTCIWFFGLEEFFPHMVSRDQKSGPFAKGKGLKPSLQKILKFDSTWNNIIFHLLDQNIFMKKKKNQSPILV